MPCSRSFPAPDQLPQHRFDALGGLGQARGDLRERQRLLGDIDHGFEYGLQLRVFHNGRGWGFRIGG